MYEARKARKVDRKGRIAVLIYHLLGDLEDGPCSEA